MAATIDVFDSVPVVDTLATMPVVVGKSFRDGSTYALSLAPNFSGSSISFAGEVSADGGATWSTVLADTATSSGPAVNYEGPVDPAWFGQLMRLRVISVTGRWEVSLTFIAA